MWCAIHKEHRTGSTVAIALGVVVAVALVGAPSAHAQADFISELIQDPSPLVAGGPGQIGMVITNTGPGPDPGVSAQLIFPSPIEFYIHEPSEENPWEWEISQGTENTCGLFVDQGGDDGGDDGIPWNDTNFFICGDESAEVDPIGPMVAGDTVTMMATVPLMMDPPPVAFLNINTGGPDVEGRMDTAPGNFGAPINEWDHTASLQLVNDGSAAPTEGCNPPLAFNAGNIAAIDRGNCEFGLKSALAEGAGAIAVIIINNVPEQGINLLMGGGAFGGAVTVPVTLISTADGDLLKAAMVAKADVNVTLGQDFPEGDWEIPMVSVVYNQLNDPSDPEDPDRNDVDRQGIAVTPGGPPVLGAAFSFAPAEPMENDVITFTDESTGNPTTWDWDFGDDSTSTDQNPTHTYAAAGTFTVTLTVGDGTDTDSVSHDVVVAAAPGEIVADFGFAPAEPVVNQDVAFTDMSTGEGIISWDWDFGDTATSTDQNPTHAYAAAGTYTVSLTVGDGAATSTATHDVVVSEEQPGIQAAFGWAPESPMVDEEVAFTDMSTGEGITTWDWTFGDDGTSTDQNPTHTYTAAGTYTVSLTVGDGTDTSTATHDVVVMGDEPDLDWHYYVAAAAFAAGAEGAFFVTDVDVNNAGMEAMSYKFVWLPRNTDNAAPTMSELFTLGAGMSARYSNVLSEVFGAEAGALGSVAVFADSDSAKIMSRTFNQPGGKQAGTFGQGIVGIAQADLIGAATPMRILFMTENDTFRGNLGLLNGTAAAITIKYQLYMNDGTILGDMNEVELPAWGNTQINQVFGDFDPMDGGYIVVWTETEGGMFTCYGSVLDNVTSDPTTIPAL